MSIEHFCFTEGVEYRSFIRWYRENKKLRATIESLCSVIDELTNKSKDQIAEILLNRSKRFSRKSEKSVLKSHRDDIDREEEKTDFDGESHPAEDATDNLSDRDSQSRKENSSSLRKPLRSNYDKDSTIVTEEIVHECDMAAIPCDAKQIDIHTWIRYGIHWNIVKETFKYIHAKISSDSRASKFVEKIGEL
jgi:hypothetical protein